MDLEGVKISTYTTDANGITANDACCVCGGGDGGIQAIDECLNKPHATACECTSLDMSGTESTYTYYGNNKNGNCSITSCQDGFVPNNKYNIYFGVWEDDHSCRGVASADDTDCFAVADKGALASFKLNCETANAANSNKACQTVGGWEDDILVFDPDTWIGRKQNQWSGELDGLYEHQRSHECIEGNWTTLAKWDECKAQAHVEVCLCSGKCYTDSNKTTEATGSITTKDACKSADNAYVWVGGDYYDDNKSRALGPCWIAECESASCSNSDTNTGVICAQRCCSQYTDSGATRATCDTEGDGSECTFTAAWTVDTPIQNFHVDGIPETQACIQLQNACSPSPCDHGQCKLRPTVPPSASASSDSLVRPVTSSVKTTA